MSLAVIMFLSTNVFYQMLVFKDVNYTSSILWRARYITE